MARDLSYVEQPDGHQKTKIKSYWIKKQKQSTRWATPRVSFSELRQMSIGKARWNQSGYQRLSFPTYYLYFLALYQSLPVLHFLSVMPSPFGLITNMPFYFLFAFIYFHFLLIDQNRVFFNLSHLMSVENVLRNIQLTFPHM